jgi:hypothetical protein
MAPNLQLISLGAMKLFHFYRIQDQSGVSGTGPVVEGVQFSNGWCALRWISQRSSVAFYQSIEDVKAIHGHGGQTEIIVHDFEALEKRRTPVQEANLEVFMELIEEASHTLNLAQDPSYSQEDIKKSIESLKKMLDDFGEKLIRRKLGRVA